MAEPKRHKEVPKERFLEGLPSSAPAPKLEGWVLNRLRSTPSHIHKPKNLNLTIAGKVMPLRLQIHRINDRLLKLVIRHRIAP